MRESNSDLAIYTQQATVTEEKDLYAEIDLVMRMIR